MNTEKKVNHYPAEFKARAVKLAVERDPPFSRTAEDLGMNKKSLHPWIKKYHRAKRVEKQVNEDHLYGELKRLKQENACLKEERALLKAAATTFAKEPP